MKFGGRAEGAETQMLRTLAFTLVLATPALAYADPPRDQFPQSAMHSNVVTDDGTVVGRVESVQRNDRGDIVAVEISGGLEPPSAPHADDNLIAERQDRVAVRRTYAERNDRVSAAPTRVR